MSSSEKPTPDEDQLLVEAVINSFLQAWNESGRPPSLMEYLNLVDPRLQPQLIVELVKIDIESRWQRGLRKLIEDYVKEIPQLKNQLTAQLVIEEFHARKMAGDSVTSQEFYDRFPELASSVKQLMAVNPLLETESSLNAPADLIDLNPGDSIDDFDLLLVLGQGAFATVFLARQRSMQRIVAVKVSADKGDEPQTLAQLDHNNIVRVYDQRAITGRGLRLLYMQYASGGTLASVLKHLETLPKESWSGLHYLNAVDRELDARGESAPVESSTRKKVAQMSWSQVVCWIAAQLSRALDYAHRQGVLHRDIKPANVLLTSEGIPKLADFNISFSKNVQGSSPAAYFGGSLAYMSPEQLEAISPRHPRTADSLDGRSDLYSLGVLTWELLTGELPFPIELDRTGQFPLINQMISNRQLGPEPTARFNSQDAPGLNEILMQCLDPDITTRFPTGLAFAHGLELCLQPAARALIIPSLQGWKSVVRHFPLITVTLLTLIPNLVAAIFNFLYNHREIINRIPEAEPTFMRIQMIINSITFPIGICSASWLAGSVAQATRASTNQPLSIVNLAEQRRRCLNLGNVAAAVGLTLWLIAAPAYPISLHLMFGAVPVEVYVHFVASLIICGLIAAAYPFFGVTLVSVRCFYSSLIDWETMSVDDRSRLQKLMRQSWLYLVLAASVPMVAIVILVIAEPDHRAALVVLAAGGVFGYALAVSMFRMVQSDLDILVRAIWRDDA